MLYYLSMLYTCMLYVQYVMRMLYVQYVICMLCECYMYVMLCVCYMHVICLLYVCYEYVICMLYYGMCMLQYKYVICLLYVCVCYTCMLYVQYVIHAVQLNYSMPSVDCKHLRLSMAIVTDVLSLWFILVSVSR